MSDTDPAAPRRAGQRVTRAVWVRLAGSLIALAAGMAALVITIDLIRSALS